MNDDFPVHIHFIRNKMHDIHPFLQGRSIETREVFMNAYLLCMDELPAYICNRHTDILLSGRQYDIENSI